MIYGRKGRRIAGVTAAVIMLALISAIAFTNSVLDNINKVADQESAGATGAGAEEDGIESSVFEKNAQGPDTVDPDDLVWDKESDTVSDKNGKNILLIGQDRRDGEDTQRSDSMIICSMNLKSGQIELVSLMRDMYVPIPGYDDNRINASYALGGMKLLDETVEKNFGIHIDGNVEVDFEGFVKAMSEVGDLEIELTQEEADYINAGTVKRANSGTGVKAKDDTKTGAGDSRKGSDDDIHRVKKGMNTLTAEQTLMYARMRYVGNGDYERTERQRTVLMTAFDKLKKSGLGMIIRTARQVLPNFTTDLTNRQIFGYIFSVMTNDMEITGTYRLPVDGAYSAERIREMEVLVPDLKKNRNALHWYLYKVGAPPEEADQSEKGESVWRPDRMWLGRK